MGYIWDMNDELHSYLSIRRNKKIFFNLLQKHTSQTPEVSKQHPPRNKAPGKVIHRCDNTHTHTHSNPAVRSTVLWSLLSSAGRWAGRGTVPLSVGFQWGRDGCPALFTHIK